jgi:hypothetical protein
LNRHTLNHTGNFTILCKTTDLKFTSFVSAQTCTHGATSVCTYRQADIAYWSHHRSCITQSENLIAGCGSYKERREMPVLNENFLGVPVLSWNLSSCLIAILHTKLDILLLVYKQLFLFAELKILWTCHSNHLLFFFFFFFFFCVLVFLFYYKFEFWKVKLKKQYLGSWEYCQKELRT